MTAGLESAVVIGMEMVRRSYNVDALRHRVTVGTAVDFHVGEIAVFIGEKDYLKSLLFFGEPEVDLKHCAVLSGLGDGCNTRSWRNAYLEAVASTVAKLGKLSDRELGAKNVGFWIVALGADEFSPEYGAFGCVGHALSNVEVRGSRSAKRGGNQKA